MQQDTSTSSSLLNRARTQEVDAWRRLVATYTPLVRHWCRSAGITDDDLPDLAQDIFAAVSCALPSFQADRAGASFQAWMRGIARHKLVDHRRRRGVTAEGGYEAQRRLMQIPAPCDSADRSECADGITTAYLHALDRVKAEFEDRTWMAFWRVAIDDHAPAEVAADMGITPAAVRQAKSRVLRRLKEELGGTAA